MLPVKVIIPCYRYAHFLTGCVESVLSQHGVDLKVLILDDASPDDTPEVSRRLAARDPRVEIRRHETNRGHLATFNEGLEWSSDAEATVLISADDLLAPGALARAVALLEDAPGVGFVYGPVVPFSSAEGPPSRQGPPGAGSSIVHAGDAWLREVCRRAHTGVSSPEVVMRTSFLRRLGGFLPSLPHAGDQELLMRFAAHGQVGEIVGVDQAYYRVHGANMHLQHFGSCLQDLEQRREAFEVLFENHGDRVAERAELRASARRALACVALQELSRALDRGERASPDERALLEFAEQIPPVDRLTPDYLKAWGGWRLRTLLGPGLSSRVSALRTLRR